MTIPVIHAWWNTTSFPPYCQTAPDFWWTVDRTQRSSQLTCTIPNHNPLDFCLWWHLKTSVYSAPISVLELLQHWEEMLVRRFKWNHVSSTECAPLCDKGLKVVLKCVGTTYSICYRDHTNIAFISAGVVFWTYVYVEWDFLAYLSEHCAHLKPLTIFKHSVYWFNW
jgi:hypothetical protein